jgi:hypothetical protein
MRSRAMSQTATVIGSKPNTNTWDNQNNIRSEVERCFRKRRREHLKVKINEFTMKSKNKSIKRPV